MIQVIRIRLRATDQRLRKNVGSCNPTVIPQGSVFTRLVYKYKQFILISSAFTAYNVPAAYNVEELLAMVQKRVIVQPEIVCL